jgi:hypothetical protein
MQVALCRSFILLSAQAIRSGNRKARGSRKKEHKEKRRGNRKGVALEAKNSGRKVILKLKQSIETFGMNCYNDPVKVF